jgi:hypothetical protein
MKFYGRFRCALNFGISPIHFKSPIFKMINTTENETGSLKYDKVESKDISSAFANKLKIIWDVLV